MRRDAALLTAPREGLLERLRAETMSAHAGLESGLNLLAEPPSQARFRRVLEGFCGFHAVWEPAVRRWPELSQTSLERSRLPALHRDLAALGLGEAQIRALPPCREAAALADTPGRALGSLYVMEGSTLGGKVIARSLRTAPWVPEAGLTYFDPYGADGGRMWRSFRAWLEAAAAGRDHAEVVRGAKDTFQLLRRWLEPRAAS